MSEFTFTSFEVSFLVGVSLDIVDSPLILSLINQLLHVGLGDRILNDNRMLWLQAMILMEELSKKSFNDVLGHGPQKDYEGCGFNDFIVKSCIL